MSGVGGEDATQETEGGLETERGMTGFHTIFYCHTTKCISIHQIECTEHETLSENGKTRSIIFFFSPTGR